MTVRNLSDINGEIVRKKQRVMIRDPFKHANMPINQYARVKFNDLKAKEW